MGDVKRFRSMLLSKDNSSCNGCNLMHKTSVVLCVCLGRNYEYSYRHCVVVSSKLVWFYSMPGLVPFCALFWGQSCSKTGHEIVDNCATAVVFVETTDSTKNEDVNVSN